MAGAGESRGESEIDCSDFSFFQENLRNMRMLDDRIVHTLNSTVPTDSFAGKINAPETCKQLYEQMLAGSNKRNGMIKRCIVQGTDTVAGLREQYLKDKDNIKLQQHLRKEQATLRMIRQELQVEEVIGERSLKTFHERCRQHYIPPNTGS